LSDSLGDTLAVAASVSGGPGADDEEFIGAGAVLSLDAEVDDGVGVAVVSPGDGGEVGDGLATSDVDDALNRRVRGGSGVNDTQSLNTLGVEASAACGGAEEANDRIRLGAGTLNCGLVDEIRPS